MKEGNTAENKPGSVAKKKPISQTLGEFSFFCKEVIKKDCILREIQEFIATKEKSLIQMFSINEQEDIREFLKSSGNSIVYTTVLQPRHGLYLCQECRNWLDLRENSSKPNECKEA